MEDFIEILFILIFIISSIVSSMRKKKKKKPANVKKSSSRPMTTAPQNRVKSQKSSADILEQMLGLKLNLPEPPQKEAPTVYSEDSYQDDSTWDPAKEYDSMESTEGSSNYEDRISAKKSEFRQDKEKHKAFKSLETKVPLISPVKKSNFSKLFSEQNNLKDFIIIQEILNKPKALRR